MDNFSNDNISNLFEEKVRTGNVAEKKIKFAAFAEKWFADYAEQQLRPRRKPEPLNT